MALQPLSEINAELVDFELKPQSRNMIVRFLIDKPQGISVSECALINKAIRMRIDAEEMFMQGYTLEVASPGLDRLLKSQADFSRVLGKKIVLTYYTGGNHIEKIEGIIDIAGAEGITINVAGGKAIIKYSDIKKAKQKIEI